jgi:hypothetical protein
MENYWQQEFMEIKSKLMHWRMKCRRTIGLLIIILVCSGAAMAQEDSDAPGMVDVVWLKDGSKLSGTIITWNLQEGMEFQLLTGAMIIIPKSDIQKVMQDTPFKALESRERFIREPKPYSFREQGWYHNTSGFLNLSSSGGAGVSHVMGYRISRMLGIGVGAGIESNDFNRVRNIIPVFAEARGFFLPKKITPYYALKLGYGIALRDQLSGTIEAQGGIHVSPELGMRFGGSDVSYFAGLEYKIQNATFVSNDFWSGGVRATDKISYRRIELRTGLLF